MELSNLHYDMLLEIFVRGAGWVKEVIDELMVSLRKLVEGLKPLRLSQEGCKRALYIIKFILLDQECEELGMFGSR